MEVNQSEFGVIDAFLKNFRSVSFQMLSCTEGIFTPFLRKVKF